MKRRDLIRHVQKTVASYFVKDENIPFSLTGSRKSSTVPRHNEIYDALAKKIYKDLEIPTP